MRSKEPVILVDIFSDVVKKMSIGVTYIFGKQTQILEQLQDLNNSPNLKNSKYPLLALFMEIPERRGGGQYANIVIPKIVIGCLTKSTDKPAERYEKTFKPILYPVYYEFLHQLVKHKNIVNEDEEALEHTKWDRMGALPIGIDMTDFIDAIEINNLNLTVSQIKNC